jgi:hypothetical protein
LFLSKEDGEKPFKSEYGTLSVEIKMAEKRIQRKIKGNASKGEKTPRNPFVIAARKRVAGPIRDRSEKRLQNKQQKEQNELE